MHPKVLGTEVGLRQRVAAACNSRAGWRAERPRGTGPSTQDLQQARHRDEASRMTRLGLDGSSQEFGRRFAAAFRVHIV